MLYEVKFLISCIAKIDWNSFSFYNLTISTEYKKILLTLTKTYLSHEPNNKFNDFVEEKKQSLITFL